jgi:putative membrane protein
MEDATRRTWLANERTWLAWVRTGLTSTGVAVAVGKVVPAVGNEPTLWPYQALGIGYALLGLLLVAYGFTRRSEVEDAVAAGGYRAPGKLPIAVLAVVAAGLALGTVAVLVFA